MLEMQIIGHIGQDAIINNMEGGSVAYFSVAHSEKRGESTVTVWVDCSLWDREKVFPYLKRGAQVWLRGFPTVKMYEDKEGQKRCTLRLNAHSVQLVARPKDAMQASDVAYDNKDSSKIPVHQDIDQPSDDLPF